MTTENILGILLGVAMFVIASLVKNLGKSNGRIEGVKLLSSHEMSELRRWWTNERANAIEARGKARRLQKEVNRLKKTIRHLLASADASWEEKQAGHDWPDACKRARETLEVEPESEGE